MSTKTKVDAVALKPKGDTWTTEDVPSLLKVVDSQIAEIKKAMPKKPDTDIEIEDLGKISDVKKFSDLVKMRAYVKKSEEMYKAEIKELKSNPAFSSLGNFPSFTLSGKSATTIVEAIDHRLAEIANETRLRKLEETRKNLSQHLSAEEKFHQDMAKLAGSMQGSLLD